MKAALLLLSLFAGRGELSVRSRTTGAQIFVDGKLAGIIPLERPLVLAAGQHTLKIVKRGFTEYLDVVVVRERRRTPIDVDLLPVLGVLRLRASASGARVFVDGKFVGESGPGESELLMADLAVGRRSVRVVKGGYRDFLGTVDAVAGTTYDLHADLAELPMAENPFRPPPPAPPKWYEHWYVWAGGATAVVAIALAIAIPAALGGAPSCQEQHADLCFTDPRH